MSLEELARTVESMRKAQKAYFAGRDPSQLQFSRDWERLVDKAVKQVLHPPEPSLFGDKELGR